ncbi:hypothetical protein [Umezawaea tangerina]|uniref:hypothetical protein n=1 Tax=Umezawaea tangerina TaxID=84725 RepID=UPI000D0604C0|nr:hypothetical protein [Umezawaea tangerina]
MARARRSGLLLALLLALLGVSAPSAPLVDGGNAADHRVPGVGSASSVPTMHDGMQDRVRLFAVARSVQATSLPDTWWAVCPRRIGEAARNGPSPTDAVDRTATASAMSTPRTGRAPPVPLSTT